MHVLTLGWTAVEAVKRVSVRLNERDENGAMACPDKNNKIVSIFLIAGM